MNVKKDKNMKRVYVASAFEDYRRVRNTQSIFGEHGIEISHDWTMHVENFPEGNAPGDVGLFHAEEDVKGVVTADALLLHTPYVKEQGCGCWVELGIAIQAKIPIFISGTYFDRSIFCRYAKFRSLDDMQVIMHCISFLKESQ